MFLGEDPGLGLPSRFILLGLCGDVEVFLGDSDRSLRPLLGYLQLAVLLGLLPLSFLALGMGKLPLLSADSSSSFTSPPMPSAARAKYLSNSSSSMSNFIAVCAETTLGDMVRQNDLEPHDSKLRFHVVHSNLLRLGRRVVHFSL